MIKGGGKRFFWYRCFFSGVVFFKVIGGILVVWIFGVLIEGEIRSVFLILWGIFFFD